MSQRRGVQPTAHRKEDEREIGLNTNQNYVEKGSHTSGGKIVATLTKWRRHKGERRFERGFVFRKKGGRK